MSTTNQIVLLSTEGDEILSGNSLLLESLPPPTLPATVSVPNAHHCEKTDRPERAHSDEAEKHDEEPIPETLRSRVFVRAHEAAYRPLVVVESEEDHRAA